MTSTSIMTATEQHEKRFRGGLVFKAHRLVYHLDVDHDGNRAADSEKEEAERDLV